MTGVARDIRMSFSWISSDGKVIILASGLRSFGAGFAVIVLGVYLGDLGLSLGQIGAFFTAGVAGSALLTFAIGLLDGKFGRRALFMGVTLLQALPIAALVLSDNFAVLAGAAFIGAISGVAGRGPVQPLEQAALTVAVEPSRRTSIFAVYRIVSTLAAAVGSLAAGLAPLISEAFGISGLAGQKTMLIAFAGCLIAAEALYLLVSQEIETPRAAGAGWANPLKLKSRRTILTLSALFSIDNFAGSLIVQSLVAYWFSTRFGFELGSLAGIFFVSNVLAAVSLWVAAKLAGRIGLINTMVFTHIPSSILLILAAFAPVGWLAVLFWQARSFFSQMDVPTRDSYTMAIVGPEERVAMASIHLTGRSIAGSAGPVVATALWQSLSAAAPFVACGVIKIAYDLSLWAMFRNVKPPEEEARQGPEPPAGAMPGTRG
ncbi:MAG: MFS transporter [Dehalococcoidia bacterium]|nr:MFS transporter [Dehalococcoidia bacterium]